jgi:cytidylate kinase
MTDAEIAALTQVVAIDGPAGAGKSSCARRVATELRYAFLDTGAMYRAATWNAVHQGIDLDDAEALAEATRQMELTLDETEDGVSVTVDGRDVSHEIRTPEITRIIYKLDQRPAVREHLVELQRRFALRGPIVAEGRDMGTVVFPAARCKVFLDASVDERAMRRMRQLAEKGMPGDFETIRSEIAERDEMTRTRAVAPLRPADDAVIVDSTGMTLDEVVAALVALARERL